MHLLRLFLLTLLAVIPAAARADDTPSRPAVLSVMRRACDYQLAAQAGTRDNGWIRSAFYAGVVALFQTTHDAKYLDAALTWGKQSDWTPNPRDPFHADSQCCVQTYAELSRLRHDPSLIAPARAVFDREMALGERGRDRWWWCDALFMASPALACLGSVTGEARYDAFLNRLWWDTTDFLYDRQAHLYYRDKSFFDRRAANGAKVFWARGNGWVMAATVRVLAYLPRSDPSYKRFVTLHREMAAEIVTLQGQDGLWRSSLLDSDQFPLPETSGTAFFTYALAWGINHGTLDRKTYLPIVQRAWRGLAGKIGSDGRLGYVQAVGAGPGPVRPEDTQEYAVGALLLAGSEVVKLTR